MATKIIGFNYDVLTDADRDAAREQAAAIRGLLTNTAKAIVEIGRRLQQVRDAIGRDKFQGWIKAEFRLSQSVASNYMRAAANFGDLDCLDKFQPTALFDLGRANVEKPAVEQAISEARSGNLVTRKRARQIIAKHGHNAVAEDAILRLRTALRLAADHVDDLLSLPQDDVDFIIDQLFNVATQLRSARRSATAKPLQTGRRKRQLVAAG
jgi:Protein of unknown function (DUF3102)